MKLSQLQISTMNRILVLHPKMMYPLLDEKQFEKEMYIQLGDLLNSPKDLTDGKLIYLLSSCQ
jgi:hypothetical protein